MWPGGEGVQVMEYLGFDVMTVLPDVNISRLMKETDDLITVYTKVL
jgi:hypothetical protein